MILTTLWLFTTFQIAHLKPTIKEDDCLLQFSEKTCSEIEKSMLEYGNQILPDSDSDGKITPADFLQKLVAMKLKFFADIGLIEQIPFVGNMIYRIVNENPDRVSAALRGGIRGTYRLMKMIKDAAQEAFEDRDWGK